MFSFYFSSKTFNLKIPIFEFLFKGVLSRSIEMFFWMKNYLYFSRFELPRLQDLSNLENNKKDMSCLLIGNGPSVNTLDFSEIKKLQEDGKIDLFVMNFLLTDLQMQNNIRPNFIVLSDPNTHYESEDERAMQLWKYLKDKNSIVRITPTSWHEDLVCQQNCLHFIDSSLEGISRNISPTKSRGYPSLTAMKTLAIALHFGYKKIFLIGYDESSFLKLNVDKNNQIIQQSFHATSNYHKKMDLKRYFFKNVSEVFLDLYVTHRAYSKFFSFPNIINLNPNSYIDSFLKREPYEITDPKNFH